MDGGRETDVLLHNHLESRKDKRGKKHYIDEKVMFYIEVRQVSAAKYVALWLSAL